MSKKKNCSKIKLKKYKCKKCGETFLHFRNRNRCFKCFPWNSNKEGIKRGVKKCNTCNEIKSIDDFSGIKKKCYQCRVCELTRHQNLRKNRSPEKIEKDRKLGREYRIKNAEKIRKHDQWRDKQGNRVIRRNISSRINGAMKRGTSKHEPTLELLGCSIEEFRSHIESLWQEGMNWENYGRPDPDDYLSGWHIDHFW